MILFPYITESWTLWKFYEYITKMHEQNYHKVTAILIQISGVVALKPLELKALVCTIQIAMWVEKHIFINLQP